MPTTHAAALTEMQKLFSKKDMFEILEYTLPRITEKGHELQLLLAASAWEPAAKSAHQLLSSADTYASKSFNNMLRHIAKQNISIINSPQFQQTFKQELTAITQTLQDWLKNNNPAATQ